MIEIFNEISKRQIQGIMFHEQMADYFDFLNLHGLKRWHEYKFYEENTEMRSLHRYVINHLNKLINDNNVNNVNYIPNGWYNYQRKDVDNATRKQAIRDAIEKWYNWEKETLYLYESYFKTLTENGKISEANKVNKLICCVNDELKCVTRKMLEYKSVEYDLQYIVFQQQEMHDYYECKTKDGFKIDMC